MHALANSIRVLAAFVVLATLLPAQDLNGTATFPQSGSFDFTLTDEGNPGQNTGSGKAGTTGGPAFTVAWERTFIGGTEYLVVKRDGSVLEAVS